MLNRGNGRGRLFHKPADYDAFLRILLQTKQAVAVRVLGLCLMPNHWHLLLWPLRDGDLSRFMLRACTMHGGGPSPTCTTAPAGTFTRAGSRASRCRMITTC